MLRHNAVRRRTVSAATLRNGPILHLLHRRAPTRRHNAAIPHLHARTRHHHARIPRHRVRTQRHHARTQRHRVRIPPLRVLTLHLATAMAAEVEVHTQAAAVRTAAGAALVVVVAVAVTTKRSHSKESWPVPAVSWNGRFLVAMPCVLRMLGANNSSLPQVLKSVGACRFGH